MKVDVGCAYYPEAWDKERIEYDAALMEQAGIKCIRVGEFCWSHLELSDGVYTFEWLHDTCRIMAKHHINIVMCTPSSTAPAWLCVKHPEIFRRDPDGKSDSFGRRDHTCYTSQIYRTYCKRIVEKMAQELQGYKNIIAWQIDNELGHHSFGSCHCPECQSYFRTRLKKKYGTIENLNKAWFGTFWSQEHSSWEEVRLAGMATKMDSTRVFDSLVFWSESILEHAIAQRDILRKYFPGIPIGSNNLCGLADRYRFFREFDYAAVDFYPATGSSLARTCFYSDLYRAILPGTAPWILESATCPGTPDRNLFRFYLWNFIARGNEKILYFHWRTHLGGYEKEHGVFLSFTGKPRKRYKVLTDTIQEVDSTLAPLPALPLPAPKAGVVFDYENHWRYTQGFWNKWRDFENMISRAHAALLEQGINSDVMAPDADLSAYDLLIVPAAPHISKAFAANLKAFVERGGVLVMCGFSGIFDGNAKFIPEPGPEHVQDLFGISLEDYLTLGSAEMILDKFEPREITPNGTVLFEGDLAGEKVLGSAQIWSSDFELTTAKALLHYRSSLLKGQPFASENSYGKGKAIYMASSFPDTKSWKAILKYAASQAGIPVQDLPDQWEMVERGKVTFVLNHGTCSSSMPWKKEGRALLGGQFLKDGVLTLPEYEVFIWEQKK